MASRPNPRIRRDWERTRARFEQEERQAAQDRARRIHDSHTARAVRSAALAFPATPVASPAARRFREAYLSRVESKAEFIAPQAFAKTRGSEAMSVPATFIGLYIAYLVLSTTIAAPFSPGATIIWSAAQLVVYFIVWVFILAIFQEIGSSLALRRYRAHRADAEAYARWLDSIQDEEAAATRALCVCSRVNSVHDADCPALTL